ncbi:MAG TPA: molybdopterin oxidoreductase [bacterium]|nr:molybdopterin oxidoreductase [bacterium]
MKDILEQSNLQLAFGWRMLLWLLVGLGVLMFIIGLATGDAERTWQAFLINTMFWSGMAFAGVIFSAIWQITDAKWGRPYKRIAEGFGAFLPVGALAFVALFFGAHTLFEWVDHPVAAKAGYLNFPFFIVRTLVVLAILLVIFLWYMRNALKPDMAAAQRLIPGWGGSFAERLLKGYGDHETEVVRLELRARRLAPILAMLFTVGWSIMTWDYLMSLDQTWFSTLFAVYVIIGHMYSALALLLIIVSVARRLPGLSEYMTINRYHDLAKLTFAFAALYAYMVFSQYLVIWYSNLPEEAPYLVTRSIAPTPWYPLFWALVGVLFVFPFLALMPRSICRRPKIVAWIAAILLIGQWWAHYLLVVPSIQDRHFPDTHFLFGAHEVLITAGFAGAFFLCFFWYMSRVPVLPISDRHLCKSWHGH